MSAQPTAPAAPPDMVNIEIDGRKMQVPKNSMIIAAADKAGIAIPRFCYHDKLPIAANCRMCMVETEMGGKPVPKPQPACATPVMEGMKIFTQSQRALSAQRNVMEFLLINHPLDCPICDQGGECELQDLSMGYGRSVSRFAERKRVVPDEDLGPLIATEMTRCIQCTRCVRFMTEVAGSPELGGLGRGENLEIGTYIGKSIDSELGGNIIDVCPVGALTNKVFRFKARAWELIARESIGYHDALGSNLWLHTRRGEVLRTVPRDNEAVNECWLSDRDRYSHEGLYAGDRATKPMIRKDGELVEASWEEAIAFVADGLRRHAGAELGALVAPLASCEEGWLLAKVVRGLGSDNIDHRLRTLDFADGAAGATFAMPLAQIEKARAILLVGSNPRHEQPLLGHRIRVAWKHGAKVFAINPLDFDFNFELAGKAITTPAGMIEALLKLAKVANDDGHLPDSDAVAGAISSLAADDASRSLHAALKQGSAVVIFGDGAVQHPQSSLLRAAARFVAAATGAAYNEIPAGANAAGLARVGVTPHAGGLDAAGLLAKPPRALLTWHAGSQDTSSSAAYDAARSKADFHVYIGAYACNGVKRTAHAVLPVGLPPEIDGSYMNVDGTVQTVAAGSKLPGDARSGWRVLRALGAQLGLDGFAFTELAELRAELQGALAAKFNLPKNPRAASAPPAGSGLVRVATVPLYRSDAVVRRSPALQAHPLTGKAAVGLNPEDALALGLANDASASVKSGDVEVVLPVVITRAVPRGAVWIESTWSETRALPPTGAALTVARA
ncbi:MAG TPA: NADH-quinone oxidoreductase subunit NuoG [Rudaea sp.]|nr:NADH-quinone oxidoreductase subunit NuoG [Rudaea sp.]HSC11963.1 NADH-quinone oxidoreductase subunit NuoG [Rhodanobacteraceae bacterium]